MHANDPTHAISASTHTTLKIRHFVQAFRESQQWSWRKKLIWLAAPAMVVAVPFLVFGTVTPPNIPAINLSADPLYTPTAADKPALALALSVEFPTVGAQYVDPDNNNSSTTEDPTYSPSIEYLGYYDAESCYTYDKVGTGAPSGQESNYKRFVRRGPAIPLGTPNTANPTWTTRLCWDGTKSYSKDDGTSPTSSTTTNDAFSGNFLNWASSSAIDMLRLALTGGDRVVDTATLSVLQRAMLPDGDPISMGNSSNFPAKRLYKSGTSRAITATGYASASYTSGVPYFGAVPSAMATAAGTNDIWVANTLNRIYFGTSKSGNNSGGFGSYTLGIPTSWIGTITSYGSQPSGWPASPVYSRGSTITLTGVQEVLYGRGSNWKSAPASGVITCNETTFTGGNTSGSSNCYVRTDTTGQTPPASTALASDPFFYARVQVCDRDTTTYALKDKRYWNLCSKYSDNNATSPQANYKPTGVVQKYSDQLRLSAFGYLMDQTASYDTGGRYGGVLRAPIKYVGAKTFDINGVDNTPSGGNPNQEWNPVTGVFNANPDSNSTVQTADGRGAYLSGVVTYLNQFGRTGSVAGRYKKYDPIGELHYEALRYFQGLQPSAASISSITTDMYDGFPVFTTWTDPYGGGRSNSGDYSCLKSNIVVIGDKNTHDGNRLPTVLTGQTKGWADASNNLPDISYWRGIVQNFEKNVASNYLDGQGVSRTTGNPNGANSAVPTDTKTSQIMGSATWARTHDIRGTAWTKATSAGTAGTALQRPGLRVKTFTFDVNEYGGSNDSTTRRSSNQLFMAAKYGGFESDPSNTAKNPYNTWGNPFKQDDGTVNKYVWEDTDTRASRQGEANTYFLQSDARGVLSAFDDIFARASTAARSIAGGAIQSKNLTQVGDTIYQGTFDTADWSGDLLAIPVSVSASNVVSIGNTYNWTAATRLAALSAPATSRNIVVGNSGATANPVAADFTWSTIEAGLKTSLNKLNPTATADGLGQDRLNYLRGDKSKEGSAFRSRSKLMGDVINSGVIYSGPPTTSIGDTGYATFYNTNKNRTPAVFVGANDGMLHAFNGNTGDELFAYIPSWLGSKLSALTATTYANSHQSYMDGTPAVAEAQVGSDWKTVLVSGTGGGGRGIFALDVTTPASFTKANVMWEFTNADDADLGFVTGRPQILKLRTSAPNATSATYKWFAVFGSGVNNYVSDSAGVFSSTGSPALFLLDLSKPAGTAWALGSNYYKISLPTNSTLSANNATGLINFRAALGISREVTQIFMGDLHGNLWKLDFSLRGITDWNIDKLSYFLQGTSNNPIPMFIAKDSAGNVQPITVAPSIVYGPIANSSLILFGTGKYLETSDKSTTGAQSVYMVYDNASSSLDSTASTATSAISGRSRLKAGTAVASSGVVTVPAFTVGRATTNTDAETLRSGWYFDYPNARERQISNATVFGDKLIFGSLIPGITATNACAASGGGGNQYTIDILGGSGNSVGSSVGILGEPLVAEISSATLVTASDSTGRRIKTITSQVFQQGSDGVAASSTKTRTVITGRLTWRQINNYQDLKNAP
ncbi:pilus assembly protein [Polaromonas sp. UC242_47]|uniref:pilus assembly protein n=1 Tax=Polaromonas sp. UC242_47 TaxID=3374626 RepID=UPI0037B48D2D